MRSLGIDIGSRTVKAVLIDDNAIVHWEVLDATSRPLNIVRTILEKHAGVALMATGYGRTLLEMEDIASVTEIKACAYGVWWLCREIRVVIDIGGQDLKVIAVDEKGKAGKFEMNDRCAAGTGKFLEIMAQKLDFTLDEFALAALGGDDSISISSLCTVFAESEVVGLLNRGVEHRNIARAVHRSVTQKIASMYKRVCIGNENVGVAGGGALNPALIAQLRADLHPDIQEIDNPQICAALGAALICRNRQEGVR